MADVLNFRGEAPVAEQAVSVEAFTGVSNATAVRIEPGEDARLLLPHLDRIALVEVNFPMFGDGRGYSAARILREAGYAGELRAVGDVLVDQLLAMRRCGFDSVAPDAPLDPAIVTASLERYADVYQKSVDAHTPIWAKRHPEATHG
ncbi:DUF934 domain-containing protein [Sphingobium aquiterrae]|uniref:DUF934 domain-containing protein n=1 Tax=Sphingobium aquiterrae TaxID=2038656 RepID=UPI003019A667